MRTLQEKYNGIQEGKFSKEHFLAEARMQQPQLITRFNGYDDAVQILKNKGMIVEAKVEEAKLTKKSLTDYRYKPTNDMDKYPYEQILRGIRVELETLGVLGTPTAEEYSKALSKVSKNLEKDSIFYTNQVAGVNPKVDLHDKMVTATTKNTVDTFNGMKKAALKEGFKKLIKKVLSENSNDLADLFDADEEREERRYTTNDYGDHGPESDFGDSFDNMDPENYSEEEEEFELQGDEDLDESRMGDVHILAQESDTLRDFLIAVKQQHPEVDIRRDIKELQDIWNNREEVNENYFSNYGSDEPTAEESETKADATYNRGADHFSNGAKDIAERLRQEAIRQGQLTHQDEEDFPPYESEDEIDYDDENFSDPLIDGEDDLYEGKKSLSELLK